MGVAPLFCCLHCDLRYVVSVGEAIWNACFGTTARALNVDLPTHEVLLPDNTHPTDLLVALSALYLQNK